MSGSAILRDVRFAITSLRRSPGFTVIAVITLGLGIGANTSMFSVFNGYMVRPAPYPDSDRVDRIYRNTQQNPRGGISPADYVDLRSEMSGYGDIAGYAPSELSLSEPGKPADIAIGLRVSANLFATLGTRPRLGRAFRADEEIAGNHRVLIISERYWRNRFASDERIIGRIVRVDGDAYDIVGVLPANFSDWRHLGAFDVFQPLALNEAETRDRSSTRIRLVGRRSATLTRAQADAFIGDFGRRRAREFPALHADSVWNTVAIDESFLPRYAQGTLAMLVGLSGFVLLIACSNLANLLLARTILRAREFAVRAALGAARAQVLRPLFAESLLLALAGGICAVFVAMWTFKWLAVATAGDNGVGVEFTFDWYVLGWAFAASLFTAVAFGVVPALFVNRLDLNAGLKSAGRSNTGDRGHQRFRNILIVGQIALAMVLLSGAALFGGGLHELNNRRHGWQSDSLVAGTIVLPAPAYKDETEIADFHRLVLERLEALPGVVSASVSYALPFFGFSESRRFLVADRDAPEPGHEPLAVINGVSPHYFETVGTRMLGGRAFTERDTRNAPNVFIINEAMARALFGNENPIGRRIGQAGKTPEWGEIVGVVADVQSVYANPTPVTFQLYRPMAQEPRRANEIAIRASGVSPSGAIEAVRMTMMSLDPDLPIRRLQPAETRIARANYDIGVTSNILSALALLGLGLSALGVYGVIARTVAARTAEFGIRLALGAQVRDIMRLVLTSGTRLALIGSALGLLGSFGLSRALAAAFSGMQLNTVFVLIGAGVLLLGVAQIACYIPARYAARTSPTEALRTQ